MNVEKSQMEEKAVHSWSRLSSAGQSAFEEALRVFNPMSKDLTDTETQLVSFLQGLREEGYQPTILSSKDVYGYNSTTADTPPPLPVGPKCPPKNTPTVSSSSKSHSKNQTGKLANPKVNISVSATRISSRHLTKNSTNLLLSSLKQSDSEKTKGSRVSFQSDLYPAMKLSVVLEALVPFKATASSLASLKEQPLVITSKQNTKGKSNKAYQALMKETSTLNGVVLNGINGKILKENDACRAFQILNGRVLINSHPHCNGMAQSKHNSGKVQTDLEAAKRQLGDRDKKRKLNEISEEAPFTKRIRITLPLVKRSPFDKDKYNFLKSSVIKIDKTSSDEEDSGSGGSRVLPSSAAHGVPRQLFITMYPGADGGHPRGRRTLENPAREIKAEAEGGLWRTNVTGRDKSVQELCSSPSNAESVQKTQTTHLRQTTAAVPTGPDRHAALQESVPCHKRWGGGVHQVSASDWIIPSPNSA
ncbi:coiled-coil domain-containing protein 71 isoform X2 [Engystomops pustulosus]